MKYFSKICRSFRVGPPPAHPYRNVLNDDRYKCASVSFTSRHMEDRGGYEFTMMGTDYRVASVKRASGAIGYIKRQLDVVYRKETTCLIPLSMDALSLTTMATYEIPSAIISDMDEYYKMMDIEIERRNIYEMCPATAKPARSRSL